jgi:DNA polymerase I-like protein with 3'-5' exonuclease and polymerase domains
MQTLCNPPEWVVLEHQVADLLQRQEEHGWYFDEDAARELTSTLSRQLEETSKLLRDRHPYVFGSEFTPKRNNKTQGYVEGCAFTKLKEFSPSSRDHISWILTTFYKWTPTQLTATGKAIIDEPTLSKIDNDFARGCLTILDLTKKLGMLAEGQNAWLKLVTRSSRIHHHCSVATSTHRAAHRNPNLAQVPSDLSFRALFTAAPGLQMVGADLSGIELRMLAHYLHRYDDGRYTDILLNGDIHQVNADKIGISRRQVKTVQYAMLYGAGDEKIGSTFDESLPTNKKKAKGREIREAFIEAIPGYGQLLEAVKKASEKGYIKAIDGRPIPVDSPHKSLNYLLQSSAAVIAKRWLHINHLHTKELNLCCSQLAFIHDEIQFECAPEHTKDLSTSLVLSSAEAGEYYRTRCPISAEAQIGKNWGDVH